MSRTLVIMIFVEIEISYEVSPKSVKSMNLRSIRDIPWVPHCFTYKQAEKKTALGAIHHRRARVQCEK